MVKGRKACISKVTDAVGLGIGYVPEDRLTEGLFMKQSIGDNLVISKIEKTCRQAWNSKPKEDGSRKDGYHEAHEDKKPVAGLCGIYPLRRQSAESRAGQMDCAEYGRADSKRADGRRGYRIQIRHSSGDEGTGG